MNKKIIYTSPSGGIHLCTTSGEFDLDYVIANDIPPNTEYFFVDDENIPHEYSQLFDAWEQSNGVITINIDKVKELTKKRLRFERIEPLIQLDIAFQRALETGADISSIVSEKQRLRDITLLVDPCTTIDEMIALKV